MAIVMLLALCKMDNVDVIVFIINLLKYENNVNKDISSISITYLRL